jgi:ribosome biogenesis GTPase A
MLLASAISERQDTAAYLRVLAKALRNYGAPEAMVTDSGGVFYSKRAMAIYEALDIRKERIDPRQSWQNYIEAHFGIMRRLADFYLNRAPTLDEMKKAHRKFIIEYQETELAFYTMEWAEDNKHIKEVKNPRLIETGYRSPQLTLWTLGPDEWLLFLKLPDYAARKKPKGAPEVIQLPLPVLVSSPQSDSLPKRL